MIRTKYEAEEGIVLHMIDYYIFAGVSAVLSLVGIAAEIYFSVVAIIEIFANISDAAKKDLIVSLISVGLSLPATIIYTIVEVFYFLQVWELLDGFLLMEDGDMREQDRED